MAFFPSVILLYVAMTIWTSSSENKTGCRFAIVDAKNEPDVLHFYEHNGFDEDFYTKPPKDDEEREERIKNPRKLRTRLMFSDLLDE